MASPIVLDRRRAARGLAHLGAVLRLPAAAIIFTWVFQHTQGSTVIAVLLHGAMNLFASPLALRPTIIAVALHWLIAVGLVAAERQERPTSKPGQSTIARTDAKA